MIIGYTIATVRCALLITVAGPYLVAVASERNESRVSYCGLLARFSPWAISQPHFLPPLIKDPLVVSFRTFSLVLASRSFHSGSYW